MTRLPRMERPAARCVASVVLPTPPFSFNSVMIFIARYLFPREFAGDRIYVSGYTVVKRDNTALKDAVVY